MGGRQPLLPVFPLPDCPRSQRPLLPHTVRDRICLPYFCSLGALREGTHPSLYSGLPTMKVFCPRLNKRMNQTATVSMPHSRCLPCAECRGAVSHTVRRARWSHHHLNFTVGNSDTSCPIRTFSTPWRPLVVLSYGCNMVISTATCLCLRSTRLSSAVTSDLHPCCLLSHHLSTLRPVLHM